ncbi:sensor histidine kinase [Gelatiniphilus marinus]|uniref:Sensor histidine kinase n=1 Tax=Gelatiniphilus marinus TaxID=1759464 RepID=A0ABW5JU63_9FLAO
MKRIIALVLLIIIPIGLVISETNKKSILHRVEKEGYSKQAKDSLWEYVKLEVAEKRIDLNANYNKKYQDPILLNLKNATAKDSMAIEGVIKELQAIFPLKEVAIFDNFIGEDYETYCKDKEKPFSHNNETQTLFDKNYDDIISYTTHIKFPKTPYSELVSIYEKDMHVLKIPRGNLNKSFNKTDMFVGFKEDATVEERKKVLTNLFLDKMYWNTHNRTYDIMADVMCKKFILKKIFSPDFKTQFENYMNNTYPWRYTNIFMNKEEAKQNANVLVAFLGLLILILSCSLFWNKKKEYTFSNYFFPVLIYTTGISSLNKLYAYLIYIDQSTNSIGGILYSFLFDVLIALIASFLLWQIEKRISRNNAEFGYQLIIKLGLTFLFLYLPYLVFYMIGDNLNNGEIHRTMNNLQFLFLAISLTLARGFLIYLNHFSENLIKQKDVELSRLKEANTQSELKLLHSHINPHFLYNALNSIAGLAYKSPEKTEKMALSLSNLFRYSINKKGQQMSTVKEEVLMVQNYLEIEKIRFGERLTFILEVDKTLENEAIPMYILQPLVENAIKHGVSQIRDEGLIVLEIKQEDGNLLIRVIDNGPDFENGLVSGHGLQTVYDLLRLSYGDKASLHWENAPVKHISISLPK